MVALRVQLLNYRPAVQPRPKNIVPKSVEIPVIVLGISILLFSILVLVFQLLEIPTSIFSVWYLTPLLFSLWFSQMFVLILCLLLSFPLPTAFFVFFSLISTNCSSVCLTCLAFLRHPLLPIISLLTVLSLLNSLVVFAIHMLPDGKKRALFDSFRPRSRRVTFVQV